MTDTAQNGSDLSLEVGGQKLNVRNVKSLNTLLTALTAGVVLFVAYQGYTHQEDSKSARNEFISALKEQTTVMREQTSAQREQNCLLKFDQSERKNVADWCKQVSGSR